MPGLSSRNPVSGADGLGRVHLRFKPKPPRKGHRVLGLLLYGVFFSIIGMSFCWSRPSLKFEIVVPLLKNLIGCIDSIKLMGTIPFIGPLGTELKKDANGVSQVVAGNTSDALYAQGYLHASDRLLQMEIYRRTALGTLSELYGNETLETDKLFRTLNLATIAQNDYHLLAENEKVLLIAYSGGINKYLADAAVGPLISSLPLDFDLLFGVTQSHFTIPQWEPFHSLAIFRLIAYEWSHGWEEDLQQFLVSELTNMPPDQLWFSVRAAGGLEDNNVVTSAYTAGVVIVPSLGGLAIAVSGTKSASNSALLVNSLSNKVSSNILATGSMF